MTKPQHFDAIVIGAGQGGGPLAARLASAGWKTAIVEREHVGGTCVNAGCTPTKTMVASARVAHLARRASDYGVRTSPVSVDQSVVRQRKRAIVESFRTGSRRGLERWEQLELIMGEARFAAPDAVTVELDDGSTLLLSGGKIFINTGTRARVPDIPGLAAVPYLTATSAMELEAVPRHLAVLGGGYIGLEFGQMFRRFGSDVTLIHRRKHLLPREDADVSEEVANIVRNDGLGLFLDTQAKRVSRVNGGVQIAVQGPEGDHVIEASHLLVAAGRVPNTERLDLTAAGLETDENGFIPVNERLETRVQGVYALGDVKGGPAFTHIAYDDYRILRTNLLDGGNATTEGRYVPYTVFIDPQLGRVGLSERQAQSLGLDFHVAKMPLTRVARALEVDETRGFMKVLVDAQDGTILGCAILSIEGGEIMSLIQIAMMGGLHYTALRDATFAHPTLAESLNSLFAQLDT